MAEGLPEAFSGFTAQPVTLGRSGAQVFRLVAPDKPTLFLKKSEAVYGAQRQAEAARLRWLQGKLPVPEVVYFYEDKLDTYLATTAVPGFDLTHFNDESSAVKRRMTVTLARALRRFHAVDARGCPFDHSAVKELGRLKMQLLEREASNDNFNLRAAQKKLEALKQRQPEEDLVLTHGDACLPNVLVLDGELAGFVDLGAAGLGDRTRDLERACWSLGYNYGEGFDEVFLEAYGVSLDQPKLSFYRDLEFFSFDEWMV